MGRELILKMILGITGRGFNKQEGAADHTKVAERMLGVLGSGTNCCVKMRYPDLKRSNPDRFVLVNFEVVAHV